MGKYPAVYCPEHHKAAQCGLVYIHYLVAESILGRSLLKEECVHHVDEDKSNYSEENIWVFVSLTDHGCYHEALKHNTDYCLFKLRGVYHCVTGEYCVAETLSKGKTLHTKQGQQSSICPKCGKPMSRHAKLCLLCSRAEHSSKIMPNRDTLKQLILQYSFEEIGRMYGVTGKAVRKWCDKHNLKKIRH